MTLEILEAPEVDLDARALRFWVARRLPVVVMAGGSETSLKGSCQNCMLTSLKF